MYNIYRTSISYSNNSPLRRKEGDTMKKIWPWLLLLLLLIIFCVWSKKDDIYLNKINQMRVASTTKTIQDTPTIEFVIIQTRKGNTLNGKFTNVQQQNVLSGTCDVASSPLTIENTSTNKTLVGDKVLELTNIILPHFLAHYKEGSIRYSDDTLKIDGVADSYQSQREMQRLLNASTIHTQDNSSVVVVKPIEFFITKDEKNIRFEGTFNDKKQIHSINTTLPPSTSKKLTLAPHRVDNGVIAVTKKILPDFLSRYTQGKIVYQDKILTISGMVSTNEDLTHMEQLLSGTEISTINKTTLDLEAIARRKAKEAELAKIALEQKIQEEKKRQEEAQKKAEALRLEKERLAQIASEKKAQEEAQKKAALAQAEAEAKRQEAEKKKAEALRLKQAKLAAQAQHAKQVAKEKIIHLLQIENIEFETAKGALTKKGKETVDKLALILKQYPKIKTEIAGHTDSDGSAEFNQKLSQSRVETVKGRLIARGVNPGRLTAKGYGETKPLVPNTTDENKQKNRRVEIIILGE